MDEPAGVHPVARRHWPLISTVRGRVTLVAVAAVAFALATSGVGLVLLLHHSLIHGLEARASAEASDVAELAAQDSLPARLPLRRSVEIQVVDASGAVVAASPGLTGRPRASELRPRVGTSIVQGTPGLLGDQSDMVVARATMSGHGVRYVYAFVSDDPADDSVKTVAVLLALVVPLLVAGAGVLAWLLAGFALRPVEEIRTEVGDITGSDLHRRVSEPPTDDEIGRLARTMNEMLARLESASERQQRFVSDASHELRSPLAALLAQLEVAQAHPDSANWPRVANAVTEEAARLWRLVDDLMVLARSDEGHLVPRSEPVDLDELALAEGERLRTGSLTVDLSRVGAGRVAGDREQLRRVVRNLADNAVHHARTRVALEVTAHADAVELVVADDGPGIPPDQRARIFERFARIDEARGRFDGGTGLGLAIVGAIVAAHGGTVEVADAPRGARMVVRLPSVEAPAPTVETRAGGTGGRSAPGPDHLAPDAARRDEGRLSSR